MRSVVILVALSCAVSAAGFFGAEAKLRQAIKADDNEAVRELMSTVEFGYWMSTLQSWIDFAAQHNSMKSLITLLYDEGFSENNEPVMMTAARLGETRAMRKLAQFKMPVDHRDTNGWTALHFACDQGLVYEANLLMELGADVNAVAPHTLYRPVHLAAHSGKATLLKMLARRSAQMDAQTIEGRNATFFAIGSGCDACIAVLAEAGVDIRRPDKLGIYPVDYLEFAMQFVERTRDTPQRTAAILAFISPRTPLPKP